MYDMLKKILKTKKIRTDADINNGVVVAVGMFDGVHLGHRAMLDSLIGEAKRLSLPSVVFTFDIGDNPKRDSKLLASQDKRLELLADLGVDVVFSASFSDIKTLSAADFSETVLYDILQAKSIVCGYDFRFGRDREGDVALIEKLLSPKGVGVITPKALLIDGAPVSSTIIRNMIANGEILSANRLLNRNYSFKGEVVHGAELGRTLGFPTINQNFPTELALPKFGVYAVKCTIGGTAYGGVANIGIKPTLGGSIAPICETYLFGYSGDCYGEFAETEFLEFIREEQRFSSLTELKEQIGRDRETAAKILSKGV